MQESKPTIELHANARVLVQAAVPISFADLARTFDLYVPFIGSTGYALYHMLATEINYVSVTDVLDHNFLLDSLNLSLPTFVRLRRKLEAVGLVKTFHDTTTSVDTYYYRLLPALSAQDFFKEQLLTGLLYKFVGEERFIVLQKRYGIQGIQKIQGEDVSAHFLQVFKNESTPTIPQQSVRLDMAKPVVKDDHFDFEAFAQLVQGTTVDEINKHRNFLIAQHLLYGVNEQQLANIVSQTVTLDTHEIDQAGMQRALKTQLDTTRSTQPTGNQPQISSVESHDEALSKTAKALVEAANQIPPMHFLSQIKQSRGGFITNSERNIVNDLTTQGILNPPVINVLLHQILIGMDNTSLSRALTETIANEWAQQKVTTATLAIHAIKRHHDQKQQSQQNRQIKTSSRTRNRMAKIEPKMENVTAKQPEYDQKDIQKALAKLKDLKTKD